MNLFTILFLHNDINKAKKIADSISLSASIKFIFADSGIEALSDIIEEDIRLIIVHEKLSHKMSGIEVCELLMKKKETQNIPIIFLQDQQECISECTNIKRYLPFDIPFNALQDEIQDQYNIIHNTIAILEGTHLTLSIINRIQAPVFIIKHEKISFANQYFLNFFKLNTIEDFSKHYPHITDIFQDKTHTSHISWVHWLKEILSTSQSKEIVMKNSDEEFLYLKIHGDLLEHSNEYLFVSQDISSEKAHAKEVQRLYDLDHLTKLPNRSKLITDLGEHQDLALAILDIDDFKLINDFYGHIIGDFVICEVAKRMSHYISHENLFIYRLPSDSFAILNMENIEREYFEIIIISLIQIVAKAPFIYKDKDKDIEIQVNLSAGLVFESTSALAHADIALREAKKTHKDYIIYHKDMQQENNNKNNLEWIQQIKIAIANDKIVPYFQPIVDNKTQEIIKYECLVRLINEKNEVISPYFFLDVAKHAKLYEPITKIMIKKAFHTFSNSHYEFSINLSIEDIIDYNLFDYIKSMLNIYPLASRVCFEILETEKIEDYQVISDFVNEVRNLGCKVSIDDFGSGYSNFSHLLNLNFDYLKIDASLIKDIHKDKNKQIIVKTIVTFAQQLGIQTIGEFVESKEIYDYITEIGITYSQGYYFSPPVETIL